MNLSGVVIRLRMVAVNFSYGIWFNPTFEKFVGPADRESKIKKAALIAALSGIPNDNRQSVDAKMIVIPARPGAANHKTPIPTTEVKYDGGCPSE